MNEEKWLPVSGYEELYEVSDHGRVRSLRSGKVLAPCPSREGYVLVSLSRGKAFKAKVHRLVAEAFIGDGSGLSVNHRDLDKRNNHVSNLEWVPHADNIRHAVKAGAFDPAGNANQWNKMTPDKVLSLHAKRANGAHPTELATMFGIHVSTVFKILRGATWTSLHPTLGGK